MSSSASSVEERILHHLSVSAEAAIPYESLKQQLNLGTMGGEGAVRKLMERNRVRLRRGSGTDIQIYISLVNDINESLSLVLDAIRACGESGIDQTQLLNKVRMPKTELGKALITLAGKNLIKEHRSFTNRAKRIYTLFHIDPSTHVTGGTMYCGEELDVAFVDEWRREITRFVSTRRMVGFDQIKRHMELMQSASGGANASLNASATNNSNHSSRDGASSGAAASDGHGVASSSSMTGPALVTVIDAPHAARYAVSLPMAQIGGGGVGAPVCSKQLSDVDLRTLVHTLVLDGVLEMLVPDSTEEVNAPQYQLAVGQSVMRHFTVQLRRRTRQSFNSAGASVAAVEMTSMDSTAPPWQRVKTETTSDSTTSSSGAVMGRGAPSVMSASGAPSTSLLPDLEFDGTASRLEALRQQSLYEPAPVSQPSAQAVDGWAYMPAIGFPCLGCPLLGQCAVTQRGVVTPKGCAYLKDWLS